MDSYSATAEYKAVLGSAGTISHIYVETYSEVELFIQTLNDRMAAGGITRVEPLAQSACLLPYLRLYEEFIVKGFLSLLYTTLIDYRTENIIIDRA